MPTTSTTLLVTPGMAFTPLMAELINPATRAAMIFALNREPKCLWLCHLTCRTKNGQSGASLVYEFTASGLHTSCIGPEGGLHETWVLQDPRRACIAPLANNMDGSMGRAQVRFTSAACAGELWCVMTYAAHNTSFFTQTKPDAGANEPPQS